MLFTAAVNRQLMLSIAHGSGSGIFPILQVYLANVQVVDFHNMKSMAHALINKVNFEGLGKTLHPIP